MFIASSLDGGAEKVVADLSNALTAQGVEVVVAAFAESLWLSRLSERVVVHRLTSSEEWYDPRLYLQLRRIVVTERPDVVHSHGAKGSAVIARVARLTQLLQVATKHNSRKGKIFNRLRHVTAVSGKVADSVRQPVEIIYNGVQRNPAVVPQASADGVFRVLAIGRLDPIKRFDWLIDAVARLPEHLHLEIVGEGPARSELTQQISALGVADRVQLIGHQQHIPELMARRHAVVIASRSEGFSLVMVEALMYANLFLSTEVGAAPELLPDALLIKEGALDDALLNMMANYSVMAQNFRAFATECAPQFEMAAVAQKYQDYYRTILAPA